jgi:cytochrome b6-f complex iron-sulfur subunit
VIRVGGAFYLGAGTYPLYRYLTSPIRDADLGRHSAITLPDADSLEAGTALMFAFNREPAILIHHADGTWVAFSAVCTHLACTVSFQTDRCRLFCACHEAAFDAHTGEVIMGPPPTALAKYRVEVGEGEVRISLA